MRRKLLLSAVLAGVSLCMQALPITRSQARLVAQELVGIDDQSIDDDAVVSPYYIFFFWLYIFKYLNAFS